MIWPHHVWQVSGFQRADVLATGQLRNKEKHPHAPAVFGTTTEGITPSTETSSSGSETESGE